MRTNVGGVAAVALLILAMGVCVFRLQRGYHTPSPPPARGFGMNDFHNAVYFPGRAFLAGDNPYSPDYAREYPVNRPFPPYSPGVLWFHAPWALLPLRPAEYVWFGLNVAFTVALAAYGVRRSALPMRWAYVVAFAGFVLLTRPGQANLAVGQLTLPIVIATLWSIEWANRAPASSGLALAVSLLKPTFGVPLLVIALAQRHWKRCAVAVVVSTALALAAVAAMAAEKGWVTFTQELLSGSETHATDPAVAPATTKLRIDLPAAVAKATGAKPPGAVVELLAMIAGITPVALLLAWIQGPAGRRDAWRAVSPWGAAACGAIVAMGYHIFYDALLLTPLLATLAFPARASGWRAVRRERLVMLVLIAFLHLNYASQGKVLDTLPLAHAWRDVLIGSNQVALGVATVVACVAAWRVSRLARTE